MFCCKEKLWCDESAVSNRHTLTVVVAVDPTEGQLIQYHLTAEVVRLEQLVRLYTRHTYKMYVKFDWFPGGGLVTTEWLES